MAAPSVNSSRELTVLRTTLLLHVPFTLGLPNEIHYALLYASILAPLHYGEQECFTRRDSWVVDLVTSMAAVTVSRAAIHQLADYHIPGYSCACTRIAVLSLGQYCVPVPVPSGAKDPFAC